MMSDPPAREHGGKLIGRPAVFPWAATGREVDVATPVLVEKPGIVLVGHVVDRIIEVEDVVVHPVHRVAHVVNAGEKRAGGVKSKFLDRSVRAAALPNAEVLIHCAAVALCRPTGGGSQRETKKQASPIATKSPSKATKMSLTCNAATKRRRIS